MTHTRLPLAVIAALAVTLAACDSSKTRTYSTAPSSPLDLRAELVHMGAPPPAGLYFGYPCGWPYYGGTFAIRIATSRTVDLSTVSLQLNDGSHLGGPAVTFPQPALTSQFGSIRIFAGAGRTFAFSPQFACGTFMPNFIAADVRVIDQMGLPFTTSVSAPLH